MLSLPWAGARASQLNTHVPMLLRIHAVWLALWQSLFVSSTSKPRCLGTSLLPDLPVAVLVALVLCVLFPESGPTFHADGSGALLIGIGVVGPFIETLLLAIFVAGLKRLFTSTIHIPLASAAILSALHSLGAPAWGSVIAWFFSCKRSAT